MINDQLTDRQDLNPKVVLKDDELLWLPELTWKVPDHRSCLATICEFFLDAGGLTAAAFNEKELAMELQDKLTNPELARKILTKRTEQSLGRLEQAVTAVLDYLYGKRDEALDRIPPHAQGEGQALAR